MRQLALPPHLFLGLGLNAISLGSYYPGCSSREFLQLAHTNVVTWGDVPFLLCLHVATACDVVDLRQPSGVVEPLGLAPVEGTAMKSGLGTSPNSFFIISPCYQI